MKQIKIIAMCSFLMLCLFFTSCKSDKHEHEFGEWQIEQEATCTKDGSRIRVCSCNEIEREVIKATGHHEDENDCSEPVLCTICHAKIKDTSDHHQFGEWKVIKEAGCATTGSRVCQCTVCKKNKTEILTATGHEYGEWKIVKEPTCTAVGKQTRTCSKCGGVETEEIEKLKHQFNEWSVTSEATCVSEGTESHTCTVCGTSEVQVLAMVDHRYGEWSITSKATCLSYGVEERVCSICKHVEEKIIDKSEHIYVSDKCTLCNHTKNDNSTLLEKLNKIELSIDYSTGLKLPTEIEGYDISWKSLNSDIITNEGYIHAYRKNETATLIATIEKDDIKVEKSFVLTVPTIDTNEIDYIYKSYYINKMPSVTAQNLVLITKNYGECQVVKYETSNPNIITADGVIEQQPYNQTATLTIYLILNGVINKYEREITILSYSDMQRVERVLTWTEGEVERFLNGEIDKLPITHEKYGGVISWFSYEPGVIAGEGYVVKPLTPKTIEISCTIVCGSLNRQADFTLENFGGNTNKIEQIKEWMKGQIPSNIMGTKNYVLENDELDYQIRTNSGGVLNLIDGTTPVVDRSLVIDTTIKTWKNRFFGSRTLGTDYHPTLSQEILDKMLYSGYQLPNEKQILWITVHESGMPGKGNNAKFLAQMQVDTANGLRNREASWNYQVDENGIYQSFEDDIICWHAGDGTATIGNGNNSSIGIEMCINEDGNYDGAMHMDAKLIAMLLHKYNLSLINVKRHYDWSGKICPNYMIQLGRWLEFLSYVDKEYTAMSILKDANVSWTVTTDDNNNTEDVLNTYFTKAGSTIWLSKSVDKEVTLHITMKVEIDNEILTHSNDLVLLPD